MTQNMSTKDYNTDENFNLGYMQNWYFHMV